MYVCSVDHCWSFLLLLPPFYAFLPLLKATNDLHLLDLKHFVWYAPSSSSSSSRVFCEEERKRYAEEEEGGDVDVARSSSSSSGRHEEGGGGEDARLGCTDSSPPQSRAKGREICSVRGSVPSPRVGLGMLTIKQNEKILLFGFVIKAL